MSFINFCLFSIVERLAEELSDKFKINYKSLKMLHKRDEEHETSYGYCDSSGNIRIGLRDPITKKYYSIERIVDTVCHELAHINTENHGKDWKQVYKTYLKYSKKFYDKR